MKRCSTCRLTKPVGSFHSNKHNSDGLAGQCKDCRRASSREYYENNRELLHARNLKYRFGVDIETYRKQLDRQGGVCAICAEPCSSGKRLAVDHDHSCCPGKKTCGECVRGLLCANCNVGIGYFNDNPDLLAKAINYLEGARSAAY